MSYEYYEHDDVFGSHTLGWKLHPMAIEFENLRVSHPQLFTDDDGSQYADHWTIIFPNHFGASVIRTKYSYGGEQGLFELAVINEDGTLNYDTPVTSDVIGYLTRAQVASILDDIQRLPFLNNPIAQSPFED